MTRLPSDQAWLTAPETTAVLDALEAEGGRDCARFVGGCVRNALIGAPVADVDIATALTPDRTLAALERAGLRGVPTGLEHGTVTAISGGRGFEVTTLRRDVSTDGRRATVAFTTDWAEDAARRDFRLNALYADREGRIHDPTGQGIEDARAGRVVFVGDPERRIREDYLRILRFFRFHAWYGQGEPDAEGLSACARLKEGMAQLSAERVSAELLKLLAAPDPIEAVAAMDAAGVLDAVLPEALERGGDLPAMSVITPDPLARLSALLPMEAEVARGVAERLRLSNAQSGRLIEATGELDLGMVERAARARLYRLGGAAVRDRVLRRWAAEPDRSGEARLLLRLAESWTPPRFPVGGREARAAGVEPGPRMGQLLRDLEDWWVANDFGDEGLADRLAELARHGV